jgi:hypothetical protein
LSSSREEDDGWKRDGGGGGKVGNGPGPGPGPGACREAVVWVSAGDGEKW